MDQLSLYNQILGLSAPWNTSSVDLNEKNEQVSVTVEFDQCSVISCPVCNKQARIYDFRQRSWRHLDTCQFKTIITAGVPRIECSEHGVQTIQVPWADQSSHYSKLFEERVLYLAKENTISAVSRQLRLSWSCIDRIIQRGISRGLNRRWIVNCLRLHVDETSIGKGHNYITVLSNHEAQVLAISEGKGSESLLNCLHSLPIQCLSKTRVISMDMSSAYIKATKEFFGVRAHKMISIDHFHVAKVLTKAVEEVRKSDIKKLPGLERLKVHRGRYVWLRNGAQLPENLQAEMEYQKGFMNDTAIAWTLKEKVREIWNGYEPKTITSWQLWFRLVNDSALKPMITAADSIKQNLTGIMVAIKTGTSNARAESINKTIKNLARMSHGYRNKERYKNMIYLRLGKLNICLDH